MLPRWYNFTRNIYSFWKRTCIHTYMHTYVHTYMFVVHFDALAQASDFRIKRRQVAFLCCDQDSNPGVCETHSPTDWMSAHKPTELKTKNFNSIARPYDERAFVPLETTAGSDFALGSGDKPYYTCLLLLRWVAYKCKNLWIFLRVWLYKEDARLIPQSQS